ncbi:3-oxoacyl-[acyl-carrier-protein] synthase II [Nitrosospira multiformis ATCC 25196]|uniref:3-oxoacyl-[acyl-carrier-protein] synthase 2 n=1 Tax=Nitrosospira multiformis (strain ATCC 25196 / NCIMB 11849 / C 71) TaxID=323848 RepID=Q2YC15_NITMU|nr:beta-ketoacyl-ACP synthase II [Nitrosospira multiformis]ABB73706.1 Beta-ketoacyl synthase [Nitrosospira multiformis ATCC 25196]SEF40245.1 3-oxoacyl-[acyl-carrier-protein] synthase II [Nitrosospira multiformis ATCC 25196]
MRVVVTGMGVVSPIGIGVDQFWSAAVKGVSGIKRITSFDASSRRSQIAGEVTDFDPSTFLSQKYIEQTDRFTQLALLAARLALEDAGGLEAYESRRIGVSIGSGMGGFSTFESSALRKFRSQPVPPFTVPRTMANSAAAWIAIRHGFKGMNLTSSTACSSGANAIGAALDLLRAGRADVVVAGGAEACVLPLTINGFEILHALTTTSNDNPARASRPFAKGRDGFVMGEGAGILILEKEEQARQRGAKIYAELAGYGQACDATHIVMPDMEGQIAAMQEAIRDAGMELDSIEHINAHATSTPLGDTVETRAIKNLFGARAADIAISATKSMVGHSIGASAAIGSIATIMALHTGTIHPTINLDEADPECDLDYTPNVAQKRSVRTGLCNAFGFGGNNASILFTTLA